MTRDYSDPDYRRALLRLFRPGNGSAPPLLAGRGALVSELGILTDLLNEKNGDRDPPSDAVLYGPRGNGKTSLLRVFRANCREAGLDVVRLRPVQIRNMAMLARRLLARGKDGPASPGGGAVARKVQAALPQPLTMEVGEIMVKPGPASITWEKMSDEQLDVELERLLVARCRKAPLVVTVDEAHALDLDVGQRLLNLSETLREGGAPFLLVLAGTPGLEEHLSKTCATFWDRACVWGIDRLSREATREALASPLAGYGVTFDDGALSIVVDESQCYPYFIQAWGKALCRVLVDTETFRVSVGTVESAKVEAEAVRAYYYGRRYREMDDLGLLAAAVAVGKLYARAGDDGQTSKTLRQTLRDEGAAQGEEGARKLLGHLSDLGYIWRPPASVLWEPGIPSLMTYLPEHADP